MIEVLLIFILIFLILIFALMISILWNIVDLGAEGVDIQKEIIHLRLILNEIKRINKNIYFKVDKFKE